MLKRRTVCTLFIFMLFSGIICSFGVKAAIAGEAIYIKADGSTIPTDAPIFTIDNVTYTLTGNISDSYGIVIERGNIVVDGVGYTLDGGGGMLGLEISHVNNVSIKNMRITHFETGIFLCNNSNNSLSAMSISTSYYGIALISSSENNISDSNIVATGSTGIHCAIIPSQEPLYCNYNRISGNNITGTYDAAICIDGSYNIICGNNITDSSMGICVGYPSRYNSIFHNNFIDNAQQAVYTTNLVTIWDVGSEGNYWSDYDGKDANQDGIGDTPYVIYESNIDHYPLMAPYVIPEFSTFLILPLFMVATLLAIVIYKRRHLTRA